MDRARDRPPTGWVNLFGERLYYEDMSRMPDSNAHHRRDAYGNRDGSFTERFMYETSTPGFSDFIEDDRWHSPSSRSRHQGHGDYGYPMSPSPSAGHYNEPYLQSFQYGMPRATRDRNGVTLSGPFVFETHAAPRPTRHRYDPNLRPDSPLESYHGQSSRRRSGFLHEEEESDRGDKLPPHTERDRQRQRESSHGSRCRSGNHYDHVDYEYRNPPAGFKHHKTVHHHSHQPRPATPRHGSYITSTWTRDPLCGIKLPPGTVYNPLGNHLHISRASTDDGRGYVEEYSRARPPSMPRYDPYTKPTRTRDPGGFLYIQGPGGRLHISECRADDGRA
ncbi:hypothetical protein B0H66DRAFT_92549 [Apodospora peruviana]|uniref:Uncharacterized protein n=1 Tax=Apodospora peruviana TaxID=516989 RepID=A0AAE0ITU6_9PEZI|nr:hypothetical protein B0H66DRAFT_92549 [Apodospora peruviana]